MVMHRIESSEQGGGHCPCAQGHLRSFLKLGGMRLSEPLFCWIHMPAGQRSHPPTHSHTWCLLLMVLNFLQNTYVIVPEPTGRVSTDYLQAPHLCTFWSILLQEPPGTASAILFVSSSSNRKTILCSLRPRKVSRCCIRNQMLDHNCKSRKSNRAQAST